MRKEVVGKQILWRTVCLWLFWLGASVIQKPLFMAWHHGLYADTSLTDYGRVLLHGLPLDLSVASYLTIPPLLLVMWSVWNPRRTTRTLMKIWLAISALMIAGPFLLNLMLYEYWGFPLDMTPFFYLFSSPQDAFASVDTTTVLCGTAVLIILAILLYCGASAAFSLRTFCRKRLPLLPRQFALTGAILAMGGVLFLAIRGGVTVSTLNTGRVYFSEQTALNHAAVNPMFSLIESAAHQNNFASQYRFMDDASATSLFKVMTRQGSGQTDSLLNTERPDVYLIILESFSSKLMKTLGGNGVAACLDSLAGSDSSILFTHFHANSFRTDRGLVSILSGYPAQPTMSLMKYPRKTATLPSITASMKQAGYDVAYYYGGDADFTNMRSYLVNQGIGRIVSDIDFPVKDRLSKWGVPDHLVFQRLCDDLSDNTTQKPLLRILQTSSSHEPFDVPHHQLSDKRLNAFAYTDRCIGDFIARLRKSGKWDKSLVILIPDHLGAYPPDIRNTDFSRYEIPLLFVGGAVKKARHIDTVGSQQDLAATLLAQLDIDHHDFLFSKNLADRTAPHFAFFTVPDAFGLVTSSGRFIYDNKLGAVVTGDDKAHLLKSGKAYLQKLYDDIAQR